MSYGFEWIPAIVLVGTLIVLMVPAFAVIAVVLVAVAAIAALIALAAALVATPYLLARSLRHLAERHRVAVTQRSARPSSTAVPHLAVTPPRA